MTRLTTATLVTLTLCTGSAWAIKPVADRDVFEPLRRADLAAIFDAVSGPPRGWEEARAKLPAECRSLASLNQRECDDEQRCTWLGARAAAIEAWSSGGADARMSAADALYRVADRLGSNGRCGRDEAAQKRWREDREQAARDAAHALLSLLSADNAPLPEGPDVLSAAESRRVSEAVRRVRQQGVSQLATVDVAADRALYRTAWQRRLWLARLPALASMRRLLVDVWNGKPITPECGVELLRNDLLEDQWRGFLVQEAVPKALTCVINGSPRAGLRGAAGNAEAKRWADTLIAASKGDAGGRDFGADPERAHQIEALGAALQFRDTAVATRSTVRVPAAPSREMPSQGPVPKVSRTTTTPIARSSAAMTRQDQNETSSNDLIRLAGRVGELIGDTERLHAVAKRARTPEQRSQTLSALLVELHRNVCAPLEKFDLGDLDAVRGLLKKRGVTVREDVCRGGGEPAADLEGLLEESSRLRQLWAATAIRTAAGLTALRRGAESLAMLEEIPETLRGESWAIVTAWTQRTRGDQVAAARALARISPDRLEQLRVSGDEHMARLVAHASVTPN